MSAYVEMKKLEEEREQVVAELREVKRKLNRAPKGNLLWCRNGKYFKLLISENGKKEFLPHKQLDLIKQYAPKRYYSARVKELEARLKWLDLAIRNYPKNPKYSSNWILFDSPIAKFLSGIVMTKDTQIREWYLGPYEKGNGFTDNLIHETVAGFMVRSKSESMIVRALVEHGIPFHYEEALHIGGRVFYPDFTIMHPVTQKLYYWEHAGMLDDSEYADHHHEKMREYTDAGIYQNKSLIVTSETRMEPLTEKEIERIIQCYFLE